MSALTEFLLACIAEDEEWARLSAGPDYADGEPGTPGHSARVLAECEAKREIIRLHESWPVLVEGPVEFDPPDTTITGLTMRATRRMAWLTGQEYRARFGSEPPTTPILRALALPYADHPDYDERWRP